jgi:hypothetical protein
MRGCRLHLSGDSIAPISLPSRSETRETRAKADTSAA